MARTFHRNERNYQPGVYTFSVNQFTKNDTDALLLTLVSSGGWPVAAPMLTIDMLWDNGTSWSDTIDGPQPRNDLEWRLGVPRLGGEKRDVAGGQVTITSFAAIACSIDFAAVANP